MKKILLILLFAFGTMFAFEDLNTNNFDQKISNKNVVIDFYTTWWGACKVLGQNLTKYETSKQEDVTIYKVDLEKQPELAKRFNVRGVPALLYIDNKGENKALEYGIRNPNSIKKNIKKYLE